MHAWHLSPSPAGGWPCSPPQPPHRDLQRPKLVRVPAVDPQILLQGLRSRVRQLVSAMWRPRRRGRRRRAAPRDPCHLQRDAAAGPDASFRHADV
eukprot:354169-Chlamydomonas_euryale.AAC.29